MKFQIVRTLLMLSLASTALAAGTAVEGTAKGAANYSVVTSGRSQAVTAGRMVSLKVGDTVVAKDEAVTVMLSDGSAVVVEKNSAITLAKDGVVVDQGTAVVGFSPKSDLVARYNTLAVKRSGATPSTVLLQGAEKSVTVESMTGSIAAYDTTTDSSVGEVSNGSVATFEATESGWSPIAAAAPAGRDGFTGVRSANAEPSQNRATSLRTIRTGSESIAVNSTSRDAILKRGGPPPTISDF